MHEAQQLDKLVKEVCTPNTPDNQVLQVKISHVIKELQDFLKEYEADFKK
jgi:hypothetical protein